MRFALNAAAVSLCTMTSLLPAQTAPASQPAGVPTASKAAAIYDRITPSLVVVQYTYDGEMGRRELASAGVVVSSDGLVALSMLATPPQLPDEQMKDFKIIIPGDDETELKATFAGRDERANLAYVKCDEKAAWKPLKFEDVQTQVGDLVYSVGLLPKEAGYKSALMQATIAAKLRGPVQQVLVSGGLGTISSPVLDEAGHAVGMVFYADRSSLILNDPRESAMNAEPAHVFVPSSDFLLSLSDPPMPGHPLELPNVGVSGMSGLKKDVAEYFGLKGKPAVQVGDVIKDFPAEKAGLKAGDVIVKLDGQPLVRGDQPEETPMILSRALMRKKPGQTITLSVQRKKGDPLIDIPVKLGNRPLQANKAPRFFAEDLGFTARTLVFEDTYSRKLPQDTPGVLVAFVKPEGAAQTAKLVTGDLILKLNQSDVKNLDGFKTDYEAFRKDHPHDAVVMEVQRGASTQIIRIEPPQ